MSKASFKAGGRPGVKGKDQLFAGTPSDALTYREVVGNHTATLRFSIESPGFEVRSADLLSKWGRQHDIFDVLAVALKLHMINWVIDADIRKFFDRMDHF